MKNFYKIYIVIATALVIPCIFPSLAKAESGLNVCNRSSVVIYVALAYDMGNNRWLSKGWWKILTNECSIIQPGNLTKDTYYYLYASDKNEIRVWHGNSNNKKIQFCVKPNEDFSMELEYDVCSGSGTDKRTFWELKVTNPSETFTLKN